LFKLLFKKKSTEAGGKNKNTEKEKGKEKKKRKEKKREKKPIVLTTEIVTT